MVDSNAAAHNGDRPDTVELLAEEYAHQAQDDQEQDRYGEDPDRTDAPACLRIAGHSWIEAIARGGPAPAGTTSIPARSHNGRMDVRSVAVATRRAREAACTRCRLSTHAAR